MEKKRITATQCGIQLAPSLSDQPKLNLDLPLHFLWSPGSFYQSLAKIIKKIRVSDAEVPRFKLLVPNSAQDGASIGKSCLLLRPRWRWCQKIPPVYQGGMHASCDNSVRLKKNFFGLCRPRFNFSLKFYLQKVLSQ